MDGLTRMPYALSLLMSLLAGSLALAEIAPQSSPVDPLRSPMWTVMHERVLEGLPYVFDERVQVLAPSAAENPANVPVMVRVAELPDVQRMVVFTDLNPIQKVLEYLPERLSASIGLRLKLEQASPVRAAVLTNEGVWHVGGVWVDAAGGGCTAPSNGRAQGNWAETLGDISYRTWGEEDRLRRLRVRVMHPMDTGLAPGIPAFYIERLELHDEEGELLGRLLTYEPISENPFFTLDFGEGERAVRVVRLSGRDINGNRFEQTIE
ncbi:MAG: quinoprotein dehydrogenase-associated SoxYZ-like carrier [Pseudomonadota bacterium]